jgi:hypothetical protein
MISPKRLAFDEVCDLFVKIGAHNSPAEMHGLLTGQLSAGKRMTQVEWLKEAREFIDTDHVFSSDEEEQLQYIYMATLSSLLDEELSFYPLLPVEDADIDERLTSLSAWCQGFLAGFALVEKSISELPEVVNDALHDIAAIAQVGIGEDDEWDESSDDDYMQIIEYIRLAAMNTCLEYAMPESEKSIANKQPPEQAYLTTQSLFKARQIH